jgi:hypothetical protein
MAPGARSGAAGSRLNGQTMGMAGNKRSSIMGAVMLD